MRNLIKFFSRRRNWSIPYALFLAVFVVVPLVLIMVYAFQSKDGGFSLENFERFINQPEAANTFIYSIGIALITTIICLVLGYPAAYVLSRMRPTLARVVVMLFILPMWITVLVRTLATVALFDFLMLPLGEGALIFGMVYNFLPFMILPVYTSMLKIDNRIVEAAKDLGADSVAVFKKIILPLTVPGIISGITMVFVPCITTFVIPQLLNNKVWTIGSLIEFQINGNASSTGGVNNTAAAISFILMIIVFICMSIFSKFDSDGAENGGLM